MRSDIRGIGIQLLKPSAIYFRVVIFGHKSPKEHHLRLNTYKTNIYERHPLLIPSKLMVRLGHHGLAIFFIVLPVCLYVYFGKCST